MDLCVEQIISVFAKVAGMPCDIQAMDLTVIGIGKVSIAELVSFVCALFLTIVYYCTDYWVINDLIGFGYIFQVIRMITIKKMYVVIML